MSWQSEVINMTRYLINDLDSPPTYSDSRIESTALVAGRFMVKEIPFSYDYVVTSGGITPDPTSLDPVDNDFLNLLSLKTSIVITGGEVKSAANSSITVTDGPSTISTGNRYTFIKDINKQLIDSYERKKAEYIRHKGTYGQVITTPTTYEGIQGGFF